MMPPHADTRGVVIVGAGGFGREVLGYVLATYGDDPGFRVKGFLDDANPDLLGFGVEVPIIGDTITYEPQPSDRFVIAVGDPRLRASIAGRLSARRAQYLTVIHPKAYVAHDAIIGEGCVIAPFATVGAGARIDPHTILTFYASVGHNTVVGASCAFSPHSVVNGGCTVGDQVFLGSHSVVNPLKTVGTGSKVAAGAVVYRSVPPKSIAAGNPAKSRPLWGS